MSPEYERRDEAVAAPRTVDRRLRVLASLLDEAIRIPGTSYRIGLDPIIGLVPGVGDLLGGVLSCYIVLEAARAGAPTALLLRMLGNIGIDTVVGAVPLAGDAFDFAWKSNSRNVRLLQRHLDAPAASRRANVLLVGAVLVGLALLAVGSVMLSVLLVRRLMR